MEVLKIEGTSKSPEVNFNPNGELELKGRSIIEHSVEFYTTLEEWIKEYNENPADETIFSVYLEYFNTATSKCLLGLFQLLKIDGSRIIWIYEEDDDDMLEAGEDYESIVKLPFEYVSVED